jgi:hypothetical protein
LYGVPVAVPFEVVNNVVVTGGPEPVTTVDVGAVLWVEEDAVVEVEVRVIA